MATGMEPRLEKIEQKLRFFMFGQQQILQKMTEFIEKVETYFHVENEVAVTTKKFQHSQVTAIEITTNSIQPSQIDGEYIGVDISQQNKIAVVAGAGENDTELDLDDCTNKSIGYTPKFSYYTMVTLTVQTRRRKRSLQIKASNFKFSTSSNFKLTSCYLQVAIVLSIRKAPRIQLQINPVLKILEDKDVLKGKGMLRSC